MGATKAKEIWLKEKKTVFFEKLRKKLESTNLEDSYAEAIVILFEQDCTIAKCCSARDNIWKVFRECYAENCCVPDIGFYFDSKLKEDEFLCLVVLTLKKKHKSE